MTQAPMCSTAWSVKETCGCKCQRTGLEMTHNAGWNTSDEVLLAILTTFGLIMLQAAMSAAGIGVFSFAVLVITVFALLGLESITWALLLIINTALFEYLIKLTVDSSVSAREIIIGPDGAILQQGSDHDSTMDGNSSDGASA
jgi:hypothetical protein